LERGTILTCNGVYEFKMDNLDELVNAAKKHNDTEALNKLIKKHYVAFADYTFYEDKNQYGSGLFTGVIKFDFSIRNNQIFMYIDNDTDDSNTNQFVGLWKSYKKNIEKICNWGILRIPCSDDLDIGVGEFSPNMKYIDNGWRSYLDEDNSESTINGAGWWK